MSLRCAAIIQARMGSSRLPGKVMLDVGGEPMLARVVTRVSRAESLADVLVATTTETADDVIAEYCAAHHIRLGRGSQFDVLDRYYQVARTAATDVVVRITADCPVIDPRLIDEAVEVLISGAPHGTRPSVERGSIIYDFVANRLPPPWKRTYPMGLDVEVCTFAALANASQEAHEAYQREHVMPFVYEGVKLSEIRKGLSAGTSSRGFHIGLLVHDPDLGSHRWTVDTAQDLQFIREVYAQFGGRDDFSWVDVLELVRREPRLVQINAAVSAKNLQDLDERSHQN